MTVFCGNDEILARLAASGAPVVRAWAPGLVNDLRPFNPAQVSVFSFGMAHKIRADMFGRLRDLLDRAAAHTRYGSPTRSTRPRRWRTRRPSSTRCTSSSPPACTSSATCRTSPSPTLLETTFFAAFFREGVRANNTSIASAMERGAVVITNLDEHSPPSLVHMDNVIDIQRCDELPLDTLTLRRLSVRAMETAQAWSWSQLVAALRDAGG